MTRTPAIAIAISPRAGIVPLDAKAFPITAVVHSNVKGPAKGTVRLDVPSGWRAQPAAAEFAIAAEGQEQSISFTVTPSNLAERAYEITAVADYAGFVAERGAAPADWSRQLHHPNRPVTGVSWEEARAFCAWRPRASRSIFRPRRSGSSPPEAV